MNKYIQKPLLSQQAQLDEIRQRTVEMSKIVRDNITNNIIQSNNVIGQPSPRLAGISITLPERDNWTGETFIDGVPIDPAGRGIVELDTDKFPDVITKDRFPGTDKLVNAIGTKNLEKLKSKKDFDHAMKAYSAIVSTGIDYKEYEEMRAEGYGGSSAYATKKEDGTPSISFSKVDRGNDEATRLYAHEFDHIGYSSDKKQANINRKSNRRIPHDVRAHEIRASNSASRAKFDNRFTNPKSPWFIHQGIEINNPKYGNLGGFIDPDISIDRTDLFQKTSEQAGIKIDAKAKRQYKKNLEAERQKILNLWKTDKEFRKALAPLLQNGVSH